MLRVRMLANSETSQVMLLPLQSASVALMPSVSVASFTFCSPLAQAEEHTNHRKTRIAVTRKSWNKVRHMLQREKLQVSHFQIWSFLSISRYHSQKKNIYSQKWAQNLNPCRRACSLNKPAEPTCSTGSRGRRCPQRTRLKTPSLPPSVWSWQSGYRWWRFLVWAGLGSTCRQDEKCVWSESETWLKPLGSTTYSHLKG